MPSERQALELQGIAREVRIVQNPALGAALVWRFVCGHCPEGSTRPVPLPLSFIVLPFAMDETAVGVGLSTRRSSGIRAFAQKLADPSVGGPSLASIRSRMVGLRPVSLHSLALALAARLITLDTRSASVAPLTWSPPSHLPESTQDALAMAERLGEWCSSVTIQEIRLLLEVDL